MELIQFAFLTGCIFVTGIVISFSINLAMILRQYGWHYGIISKCLLFMLLFSMLDAGLLGRVILLIQNR